eukprot:TRINITY_DN116_c1_g1_i1.p1 TRINITY_DN116_c1_g1~~TRINITY_DN116_c1_g1_i1.p1  ORF type:complete len:332 (+),score=27.68 TRINITY_DN116_c1_g1_i1:117-998(+)
MEAYRFISILYFLLGVVQSIEWNYDLGGSDWEGTCATGLSQSPINIPFSDPSALTPEREDFLRLDFEFDSSDELEVFNNGHAIVISSNSTPASIQLPIVNGLLHGIVGGGSKTRDNTKFVTAYFSDLYLHQPSEHFFDGLLPPMEAQMVMRISKQDLPTCPTEFCLAMVSFRFTYTTLDTPNTFISQLLQAIGGEWPRDIDQPLTVDFPIDFEDLLPTPFPGYVVYSGSLTTPPCTEYVLWHVIQEPLSVSVEQVASLEEVISLVSEGTARNSRTIQPLNGRTLGYIAPDNDF